MGTLTPAMENKIFGLHYSLRQIKYSHPNFDM